MKAKNATLLIILSFFISSPHLSYSMNDDVQTDNSNTSMLQNYMMRARQWGHNFYRSYQTFGIIPTISASFNMYNFKRITGLDEDKLATYGLQERENAINRINKMIEYKGASQKLAQFLNKIENARLVSEITEETNPENIPYNEEEAAQYTEEALQQQSQRK
jgi:hypothetical protein